MGIKYFIYETKLQNQTQYVGRIILKDTYDQEGLVDRMLQMGTSLTKTDIRAVLTLLVIAVEKVCREGFKINLNDFLQFTPVMGGLFEGREDTYDPSRNALYLTAQVSQRFNRQFALTTSPEKVVPEESRPQIFRVDDRASTSGKLIAGHIIVIRGHRLKFDPANADESLVLVSSGDPATSVKITDFHQVGDQEIVFLMPSVPFTEGFFELTATMGTKSVRRGQSKPVLLEATP